MLTPDGPACDHCHRPFNGRPYLCAFFMCHMQYCSSACLEAAEEERKRRARAEEFTIARHGTRFWKVVDGNGDLVCVTVYKKGAAEVVRRLGTRKPPPFRPETGASASPAREAAKKRPIEPIYRQRPRAKSA